MDNSIEKKEAEVKEIKIRKLKVADRKRISSMIEKLAETAGESSLLNAITSAASSSPAKGAKKESSNDSAIEIGVRILRAMLKTFEDETHEWFANLINVDKEEFLELPLDTELKIIQQIVSAEESSSFFTIASQLYSKIESLQSRLGGANDKSGTIAN